MAADPRFAAEGLGRTLRLPTSPWAVRGSAVGATHARAADGPHARLR
jgi:hypothetical protein